MDLFSGGVIFVQRDDVSIGCGVFVQRCPPAFQRVLGQQQRLAVSVGLPPGVRVASVRVPVAVGCAAEWRADDGGGG